MKCRACEAMKCRACEVMKATVPDRDDWPRYRIRLCADCHADRLRGDLEAIAAIKRSRRGRFPPFPKETD